MSDITFDGQVVLVTGSSVGLGRSHALHFARRAAKVVVNDISPLGTPINPAVESLVAEINDAGGEAMAGYADVSDPSSVQDMMAKVIDRYGRIDVVVNNAGILRDGSFAKMTPENYAKVVNVHLNGSAYCALAAWPHMRAAGYGRIVMTSSNSGLYGNFGQSNYSAAKLAVVALMNVLVKEGRKYDIRVNSLVPGAATQMTEASLTPQLIDLLSTDAVSPAALFLASKDAPNGAILAAAAGGFSRVYITETDGVWLDKTKWTPEDLAENFEAISDRSKLDFFGEAIDQTNKFLNKAAEALNISL